MKKISIFDLEKILKTDIREKKICIEINFCIDTSEHYASCWLGKLMSKEHKEVYWFGLTSDGTEAYSFDSIEQLLETRVFTGNNLKDIWKLVTIISIDSCDVEERLGYYK